MIKRFINKFLDYSNWKDIEKSATKVILLITGILTLSSTIQLIAMFLA